MSYRNQLTGLQSKSIRVNWFTQQIIWLVSIWFQFLLKTISKQTYFLHHSLYHFVHFYGQSSLMFIVTELSLLSNSSQWWQSLYVILKALSWIRFILLLRPLMFHCVKYSKIRVNESQYFGILYAVNTWSNWYSVNSSVVFT